MTSPVRTLFNPHQVGDCPLTKPCHPTPILPMNSFTRLAVTIITVVLAPNISHAAIEADSIRPERELFITAPFVVDAPEAQFPNAWSFGRLMQELIGEEL